MAQKVPDGIKTGGHAEACTEEQAYEALQNLDRMRSELTRLRATIPGLIAPFLRVKEIRAPEVLYKEFAKQATTAVERVATFKSSWEKNLPILERANAMRRERPEGMPRVGPMERLEFKKDTKPESPIPEPKSAIEREKEKEEESDLDEDSRPAGEILEEFKKNHPKVQVNWLEVDRLIQLTLPKPNSIRITVKLPPEDLIEQSKAPPTVTSIISTVNGEHINHVHLQMMQSISTRPHPNNLALLLEMLATYEKLFTAKCDVCEKLVSTKAHVPYVRRRVALKRKASEIEDSKEGKPDEARKLAKLGKQWRAFHEGCWDSRDGS